jgi:two-component system, OmpR family, phosphate regulon response regulator OmpR
MKKFVQYHILVIDDDSRLRNLLQQYLAKNNFLVSTAENTVQARKQMQNYLFDLLVVDVMMPGENGMDFVLKLREQEKNLIPVLMLTAMGQVDDRVKGLEQGADDYLVKPFEPKELVLRIKSILARTNKDTTNNETGFGDFSFNLKKLQLRKKNDIIYITANEANLLNIFCKNLGRLLSREDLREMCGEIDERTIDVQITRLRKKIEDNPRQPKYLQTVRGKGYVLYG